ncbi:MAG: hypothetical protein M0P31_05270 [Solirubrobacteraceae bacterium]|nr:hypothetical protein [Solirubrobacteraceae bacterium]
MRSSATTRRILLAAGLVVLLVAAFAIGSATRGDDPQEQAAGPAAVTPDGEPPTTYTYTEPDPVAPDETTPQDDPDPAASTTATTIPTAARGSRSTLQRAADAAAKAGGAGTGVAVGTLGPGTVVRAGSLTTTHAWSTSKPAVLAAVLRARRAGRLGSPRTPTAQERAWATRALTVSDNAAAISLFGELEQRFGGVDGASRQVEAALRAGSGKRIAVNRKRRESFTTFGQTNLRLTDGVRFYGGLAGSCVLPNADTRFVVDLMRRVDGSQRWGLGSAPWDAKVAFKGGWGPESGGRYVAVQYGVLRKGSNGVVVAIAAQARGGLEAVTPRLTAMAKALEQRLPASRWPPMPKTCPDA